MFDTKVTLFNFSKDENEYYPTLLVGVELQPHFETSFTEESTVGQI